MKKTNHFKLAALTSLVMIIFAISAFSQSQFLFAQDQDEAATTEETASKSGVFDPQVVKELIKRVKVKGENEELSQRKRGFIGQVERLTEESVTLENQHGTQVVPVNATVKFLKNGRHIELTDVAVGDWLVVMGLIEDDAFSAKRILVSSASLRPKTHLVTLGTIVAQDRSQLEIVSRQKEELEFDLDSSTTYQDFAGQEIERTQLIKDLQVLVVGTEDDTGKTALIIRALASLDSQ